MNRRLKTAIKALYWWVCNRTVREYPLPPSVGRVLFVCQGNVCRSPFAKYAAEKLAVQMGLTGMTFDSAGIRTDDGLRARPEAVAVAKRYGVCLESHRTKPLEERLVRTADLVLVMEYAQYRHLSRSYRGLAGRIALLPRFQNGSERWRDDYHRCNIPDPYGGAQEAYERAFDQILDCLDGLLGELRVNSAWG